MATSFHVVRVPEALILKRGGLSKPWYSASAAHKSNNNVTRLATRNFGKLGLILHTHPRRHPPRLSLARIRITWMENS
jgi:GT2 family glycosyltransferase